MLGMATVLAAPTWQSKEVCPQAVLSVCADDRTAVTSTEEQMKQMCSGVDQMPPSMDVMLKDCPKMQEKIQLARKLCGSMKPGDDGDKKPDMPDGGSLCATLKVIDVREVDAWVVRVRGDGWAVLA